MKASRLVDEDEKYVKFNDRGQAWLVPGGNFDRDYSYRKVHYTHEDEQRSGISKKTGFRDPEYTIDERELENLVPGRKLVLKRLYDIYRHYPKEERPKFFETKKIRMDRDVDLLSLPTFATEIGLLPVEHYRSLFITQDFEECGLYQVIINQNGRWETDVVDDYIPVYKDTLEPIWGMNFDHSWQIILLKFWAKKNQSYTKVKNMPPFEFIEFFTNSNWKYFNLERQNAQFLNNYTNKQNIGKFVLKTKNNQAVTSSGLIKNSAGYEIINIDEVSGKEDFKHKKWNITVRSTLNNKWAGNMSVLDKEVNTFYSSSVAKTKYNMALERDFIINEQDFFNLFSACWIASLRDKHNYFSDYKMFEVSPNAKNSVYLAFEVSEPGWFDFCVKQFDTNKVPSTNKSKMRNNEEHEAQTGTKSDERYLKCKFLLTKELNFQEEARNEHWKEYNPPKYELYEIEYLQGYNRGDARFENIIPGRYILKIKTESINRPSKFVVNYACNSKVVMHEIYPSKNETSLILRSSLASLVEDLRNYSLDKNKRDEQICFSDLSDNIGYAFVAVRSKKINTYNLLIQVDPELVRESGYKLKNQFKRETGPFSVLVKPGQSTSIVFKKINDGAKTQWPPKGVDVFKTK